MSQTITFLHTAAVHQRTFDALAQNIAPDVTLVHHVHSDWLERARKHGIRQGLLDEMGALIHPIDGPVICTCSTLGEAAEAHGALRIDAPMMQEAARLGGPILLVHALHSTLQPSLSLLEAALAAIETPAEITPLDLSAFWPLFEAGEVEAFTACVAGAVKDALEHRDFASVVLTQASMAASAPMLGQVTSVPILTSPELALRHALTQIAQTPTDL